MEIRLPQSFTDMPGLHISADHVPGVARSERMQQEMRSAAQTFTAKAKPGTERPSLPALQFLDNPMIMERGRQ